MTIVRFKGIHYVPICQSVWIEKYLSWDHLDFRLNFNGGFANKLEHKMHMWSRLAEQDMRTYLSRWNMLKSDHSVGFLGSRRRSDGLQENMFERVWLK
jgi:hypothetical protein